MGIPDRVKWLFRRDPEFQQKVNSFVLRYLFGIGAPILGGILLLHLVPDLRAEFGHGTPGTFTAKYLECQEDCRWYGQFISDDGRRREYDVYLEDAGRGDLTEGARRPAIDAGSMDSVYPPGGPRGWGWRIFTLVAWVLLPVRSAFAWRAWLRDRRDRSGLDAPPGQSSARTP